MVEQLVRFATAKLARDKGFNLDCSSKERLEDGSVVEKPRQDQLQKWLRSKNIHCQASFNTITCKGYYYTCGIMGKSCNMVEGFKTYEGALEEGLYEALELLDDV